TGAGLTEIYPQALARPAERDRSRAHALGLQGMHRGVADGVVGQPRDVIGAYPEVREPHGDIGLAPAEARAELGRLKQPLRSGRAEAQHQLAERHGAPAAHAGASAGWRRASATRSISARARAVSRSQACSVTSDWLTKALQSLTAVTPSRIQSPALTSYQ